MKKSIVLLLLVQLLLVLSPLYVVRQETTKEHKDYTFTFPSSLETIESEAFAGTEAQTATFQKRLQNIGKKAFHSAVNLKDVYLPDSVVIIADSAFPKNKGLTIHGVEGSFAQQWAEENGFEFVEDDIWADTQVSEVIHVETLLSLFWIVCSVDEKAIIKFFTRIKWFTKSMRPQDRPELYPINYRFP